MGRKKSGSALGKGQRKENGQAGKTAGGSGGGGSGGSKPRRVDEDNFYKDLVQRYFWEAIAIFAPPLYAAADVSRDPVFLEQEMRKLNFDSEGGAHHVDMLARINLLGGEEPVVFCHIEIQGKGGGDLPTRMYAYRSEIYLKLKVDPIGIVALTDKRPEGEKTFYIWKQFGVVSFYKYLTVSILDLPDEVLLANDSHIGLVLYALKCAKKSGNDEGMKFRYLKELSKMWLERKWEPKDKADILLALDYQMRLRDPDYRRQMVEYMSELTEAAGEEERHMYVSMFEEVYSAQGRAEGMAQGMEKGMARGMARGRTEGRAEVARSMLADGLPPETVRKYTGFTKSEIARLKKADA